MCADKPGVGPSTISVATLVYTVTSLSTLKPSPHSKFHSDTCKSTAHRNTTTTTTPDLNTSATPRGRPAPTASASPLLQEAQKERTCALMKQLLLLNSKPPVLWGCRAGARRLWPWAWAWALRWLAAAAWLSAKGCHGITGFSSGHSWHRIQSPPRNRVKIKGGRAHMCTQVIGASACGTLCGGWMWRIGFVVRPLESLSGTNHHMIISPVPPETDCGSL